MAGLKEITVNTAPEAEPHIYAEDDAAIYKAIFGGDGVSSIGQACKATVLNNNKIRIADGVLCVDGHMARIPYGEYEDCEIANGQSGKNRNDIIVARFSTTGTGGIDTMTCEVIQGSAGSTAEDPKLTQDDIYKGGKIKEYPLYRVKIEGLNIVAVEQMFEELRSADRLLKEILERINKTDNLIELLTNNAKIVQDCLTQTGESGIYKWYNATNQPCTGGYIIVFKYNNDMSFRIAIGNSGIYASIYRNGTSYGTWRQICSY